jgi:hypothetical protein
MSSISRPVFEYWTCCICNTIADHLQTWFQQRLFATANGGSEQLLCRCALTFGKLVQLWFAKHGKPSIVRIESSAKHGMPAIFCIGIKLIACPCPVHTWHLLCAAAAICAVFYVVHNSCLW